MDSKIVPLKLVGHRPHTGYKKINTRDEIISNPICLV